jgi:HK97 family phage portal protein
MGILSWITGRAKPQPATRDITYSTGLACGLIETPTLSGVHVTAETALGVSAVWAAVNAISQTFAKLPLILYRHGDNGERDRAEQHDLYDLLAHSPNEEQTRCVFWQTFIANALLFGNGYAEVVRSPGDGRPESLWLIDPRICDPARDKRGRLVYVVRTPGGEVTLDAADVLHVPGLTCPDGSTGYHLLKTAREVLGFTIACDRFGSAYFGNSAKVGGVLEHPGSLSDNARENLRKSWNAAYQGVTKTGTVALLEEGTKFSPFTISNEAGQYDETRRFQIAEVSRLFNISPVHLHELGRATWGNLTTLQTEFWNVSCHAWAEKTDTEIEKKLLTQRERGRYYVEFLADTLLRGDITTRITNYSAGIAAGFYTVAEVRQWENLPALPEPEDNVLGETPEDEPTEEQPGDVGTGDTQLPDDQGSDQQQGGTDGN